MRAFFMLILAVAVSTLIIPLAMRLAPAMGMIDTPDPRKVHRAPIPRVGGWGIVIGCLLPLLALNSGDRLLQAWAGGCLVLFLFGAWDDARQIGHWVKFAGQFVAVGLVVFWGGLYVTRVPFFDGDVLPPLAGQLFTLFAMVGMINAINHADGLDGLAGGETLLSLIAIAFLGHLAGATLTTDVALATIGGTVGFLRYNTHPARVFMGDAGSQFLGFTVAFLGVHLAQVASPGVSAALPLLLLGLPIADILVVLYKRAAGGGNWFKATRNHIHHRLLDLGFTHGQSVVVIYSVQLLLVLAGVLLRYASDALVLAIWFGVVLALFQTLGWLERGGLGRTRGLRARMQETGRRLDRWRQSAAPQHGVLWFMAAMVSGLCAFAVLWAREIPRDLGFVAACITGALALATLMKHAWQPMVVRVAAYTAVTFSAWLFVSYPQLTHASLAGAATVLVLVLAVVIAVFVRFMSDQRFGTTPTDYLIAFSLLALGLFRSAVPAGIAAGDTVQFVAYAIVLFYGCEVLISHFERWRSVIGGSAFATLLVIAVRGLGMAM